jgi:hypothetical protein
MPVRVAVVGSGRELGRFDALPELTIVGPRWRSPGG